MAAKPEQYRLAVCGSRSFTDYKLFDQVMLNLLSEGSLSRVPITILSGGARGPDTMAIQFARKQSLPLEVFPADWASYGRSAGIRRNRTMADSAHGVLAFWDGKSPGTDHMISYAGSIMLDVFVVRVD